MFFNGQQKKIFHVEGFVRSGEMLPCRGSRGRGGGGGGSCPAEIMISEIIFFTNS